MTLPRYVANGTRNIPLNGVRMSTSIGLIVAALVLSGCGSSGVSSASDAEAWVDDRFTSDQMEVSDVECEDGPGERYRCMVRTVTLVGVIVSTGWVDCEDRCRWRPVETG